jgi:membrane-bound serine protease (ClpP class)
MVIVIGLVGILTGFSALVLYKIVKAKKKRLTVLELIGGVGRTLDEIGPEKVGFIRFRGEYWKARSDTIIKPNRRVKILAKEGPTLIVELIEEEVIAGKPEKSKPSQI